MNKDEQLKLEIALTLLPNVGPVLARNLVSYCGSVEAVFKQKQKHLEKIPEIGPVTATSILKHDVFERAEEEVNFIRENDLKTYFFLDDGYPKRLKNCNDAPAMLYFKGKIDFNQERFVAIVGTRTAQEYGKQMTDEIVASFKEYNVNIISGMAFGIDIRAHRAAVKNSIPTVGVLAHGLDRLYPGEHSATSEKMFHNGGLLTEYTSKTIPDKENFPSRNRIVAGITDAVIVVEAAERGGALITAEIANSYSRDVFAIPGKVNDHYSKGCNRIIRQNKAALVTCGNDILEMMGWKHPDFLLEKAKEKDKLKAVQKSLFVDLSAEEELVVSGLKEVKLDIDILAHKISLPMGKLSAILFSLEMKGIVRSLPGKIYELV
jgi:DNA processing protein